MELVLAHLWRSLQLSGVAVIISVLIALPLGIWASVRRGTILDSSILGFALFGQATPVFWLGIMLIWFFSVQLQWLPVSGRGTAAHFVLPVACIAAYNLGILVRIIRSAMLEVLQEDYVMTARSKGLNELNVILNHAFRNGSTAVVSIVGLQIGILLSGALVVETIFAWPGLGKLLYDAVLQRDYPLVMTGTLVVAILIAVVNLLVDISYAVLDPRIRYK
jgi:peptide/nickel transport system permease protein